MTDKYAGESATPGSSRELEKAHADRTQPPTDRLTGLRYQEQFVSLTERETPTRRYVEQVCGSGIYMLTRLRVWASARSEKYGLITLSMLTLPPREASRSGDARGSSKVPTL
jgi:hypothetical protein